VIEVTYVDHMGSDLSVVNAARVSFGKKSECEETRWVEMGDWSGDMPVVNERDSKLIKYLAREKHYSPFNHTYVTFHVKAPVFVARQLVKHEYMPWNEISRRYVDTPPEFYVPDWREVAQDKKQGSGGPMGKPERKPVENKYEQLTKGAARTYRRMLELGVCEEQARMVLPQSMMTEWYWSGTMKAVHKMCSLRCKPDTQYESRIVAEAIDEEMAKLFPVSWEALRAYEE
jgi:thymidylate synthase (FAD)